MTLKALLHKIPLALIYSRLLLGPVVLFLSFYDSILIRELIVGIMIWAIVSDIFDGIIARSLNISNEKLRRLDSSIDQIFWIFAFVGAFIISPQFFRDNLWKLSLVIALEALTYAISYLRFKKEVATHAILSKFWALTIVATLIEVILRNGSGLIFNICFYLGVLSRIEIIAILLILRKWTNDVPSVFHAIKLRKGEPIKRNKMFNG
ncbi:CDP-alcohol phosphatidyltransferase family protein [Parabacteroides sp. FAFU027]|uniref:CDP-alcohol phosphatidyltransferase family protein n=1 Tax=Parabacteroides sp. FAFU027 TaxID=2922715 RepID=UPI001FAEC373|nr:CDP-alcohol phosphatidyltransferase family protein [Parabacteroides sp. FAFU027]